MVGLNRAIVIIGAVINNHAAIII